jgi:hypothetical protein
MSSRSFFGSPTQLKLQDIHLSLKSKGATHVKVHGRLHQMLLLNEPTDGPPTNLINSPPLENLLEMTLVLRGTGICVFGLGLTIVRSRD